MKITVAVDGRPVLELEVSQLKSVRHLKGNPGRPRLDYAQLVKDCRIWRTVYKESYSQLARRFGVSKSAIGKALKGKQL